MRNVELKRRLYVIIFQSDTPLGKLFDVTLLWAILLSILVVVVESIQGLPPIATGMTPIRTSGGMAATMVLPK